MGQPFCAFPWVAKLARAVCFYCPIVSTTWTILCALPTGNRDLWGMPSAAPTRWALMATTAGRSFVAIGAPKASGADAGHLADALMPAVLGGWGKFFHRPTSRRLGPGRSRVRRAPIDLPVAPLHVALRCGERGEAVPRV